MKKHETLLILRALLNAVDPDTGETLLEDHILNRPDVREALAAALKVMEADAAPPDSPSHGLNAGRPWTQAELDTLRRLYESGVSVSEIARLTRRRDRGVRMQLNLMAGGGVRAEDRVEVPDVIRTGSVAAMAPAQPRRSPSNSHHPWTAEADAELTKQFQDGRDPAELAVVFGRSAYAIEMRLQKLGLISADSPDTPVRPWSKDDTAELRRLCSSGLTIPDIAVRLKRSESAVSARLLYMSQNSHVPEPDLPEAAETGKPTPEEPVPAPEKPAAPPAPTSAASTSPSRHWTDSNDAYLRQAWAEGVTIQAMCSQLNRRERLVRCRLIYLDLADHSILGAKPMPPELAHQGLPWYPEELSMLQHMYRQGRSLADMALTLRRDPAIIRNRLDMLGLTNADPD